MLIAALMSLGFLRTTRPPAPRHAVTVSLTLLILLLLSILSADHAMRVIELRGDDLEGVAELPGPPEPPPPPLPPHTQVEGALSGIEESVHATPTQLKGKGASSK